MNEKGLNCKNLPNYFFGIKMPTNISKIYGLVKGNYILTTSIYCTRASFCNVKGWVTKLVLHLLVTESSL
jgi:hypothetical protein